MASPRRVAFSVVAVSAAMFADSLLYSIIVPVLPVHAESLGASQSAIGVLFASYAVALLAAIPVFGVLSDRIGRRVPLIAGMVGVSVATTLFAFADSYVPLVAARSVQGLAAAAVWTCGIALVADIVPATRLGASMGIVMASMSAGLITGPPLGGLLAESYGYRAPFVVCAVITAGCALLQVFVREPPRPAERSAPLRELFANRTIRSTTVAVLVGAGTISMLEPLLPIDMTERLGAGAAAIGLAFGTAALAHLLASPAVGALADRRGSNGLIPCGLLGMALVLPFLALPGSALGVTGLLVGFAIAYSFILIPALTQIGAVVRDRGGTGYAAAYGLFNMAYALGMVAGPLLGSVAVSALSLPVVLTSVGACLAVGGIVLLRRSGRSAHPLGALVS